MPIHRADTVKSETNPDHPCGPFTAQLFSDAGGLTQFGAFVEILPPGSSSSIKHWHAGEDEMVYMIAGQVTVHEGDATHTLNPGDAATFKAGVPAGHSIENTSNAEARYLVIGTRSSGDTVTYPECDRTLGFTRHEDGTKTRVWTDHAGNPATSAYADLKASKDRS